MMMRKVDNLSTGTLNAERIPVPITKLFDRIELYSVRGRRYVSGALTGADLIVVKHGGHPGLPLSITLRLDSPPVEFVDAVASQQGCNQPIDIPKQLSSGIFDPLARRNLIRLAEGDSLTVSLPIEYDCGMVAMNRLTYALASAGKTGFAFSVICQLSCKQRRAIQGFVRQQFKYPYVKLSLPED